jgi:hypothetical protein
MNRLIITSLAVLLSAPAFAAVGGNSTSNAQVATSQVHGVAQPSEAKMPSARGNVQVAETVQPPAFFGED